MQQPAKPQLIDLRGIASVLSISPGFAKTLIKTPHFPARIVLAPKVHRWRLDEIERWINARKDI